MRFLHIAAEKCNQMCTRDRERHQEEDADNAEQTNVGILHLNGSLMMQDPVVVDLICG